MKPVVVSLLTAAALSLCACSHTAGTAALGSVPVASLTAEQMRAELAAITEELDEISRRSSDDQRRARTQMRVAGLTEGKIGAAATVGTSGSQVEGPLERQAVNSARRLGKVESLRKRQDELRAQLAGERQG